jgi:SAM-dependent methyltransferase
MTGLRNQQERPADPPASTGSASGANFPAWLESRLICPACRAPVGAVPGGYRCDGCSRQFPVRFGIPDFRLHPDPYISIEAEIAKIERLLSGGPKSFIDMLAAYYVLSPENPPVLNQHYVSAMQAAVTRGRGLLARLTGSVPGSLADAALLDVGCGTAGLLAASPEFFARTAGVDVALRWLLMGRQRLKELGVNVPLICANAEALPFADATFDAVSGDAVIEHVRQPVAMRDETIRVLRPGGKFLFTTNNRYSMLPEPHLRILGFGLLPRRLMERTAMRFRRTPYRARLLSLRELAALFRGVARITLPVYEEGELGPRHETIRRGWEKARRYALVRGLVWPVSPQYVITGTVTSTGAGTTTKP